MRFYGILQKFWILDGVFIIKLLTNVWKHQIGKRFSISKGIHLKKVSFSTCFINVENEKLKEHFESDKTFSFLDSLRLSGAKGAAKDYTEQIIWAQPCGRFWSEIRVFFHLGIFWKSTHNKTKTSTFKQLHYIKQ